MLDVFNEKFDFFKVTPYSGDIRAFVEKHFEEYIGKMYHTEGADFVWFAFDHGTTTLEALRARFRSEATVTPQQLS